MRRRSWEIAERLSWPVMLARLLVAGAGTSRDIVEERVDFGGHPSQHALVVRPARADGRRPLVYFVHGGSWRYGSPERFRAIGRFFARHGYATALGGYRLLPEARFPAQRDDVLAGIAAVVRAPWFTDRTDGSILLAGQSAGGQLAALAAFDDESRDAAGLGGIEVAGLLAVSGVLDFDVLCPPQARCGLIEELMGGRDGWDAADPARFVHGSARTPILCLHGSRDPLVPVEVSASFVLRANGAEGDHAVFMADPGAHHADMLRLFLGETRLTLRMLEWMDDLDVSRG